MDDFLGVESAPPEQQQAPEQEVPSPDDEAFQGTQGSGEAYGDFGGFAEAQPEAAEQQMPHQENGSAPLGEEFGFAPPADGDGLVEQAPAEEPAHGAFLDGESIPEPAAPPPEPETEDPRVLWRKKNQKELAEKDKEEMEARMSMKEKGSEHLKKVKEAREKRLSARKNENRANNFPKPEAGSALEGTTWQKVNKLVSYNSGTHAKDVARMKTTLTSLNAAAA
uniref:Clathrin light chain n=1 Tax=Dunaliella tertiolecta TaxID=3047 RepID=A0A7S3R6F8_DUNTE|mmetsp:Transcript_8041/g.21424  ORF Transcript_8041/g.21424 Transcript_8041/m.21424 type:complete len:223 (+) Transcript_8041:58-726(+)|eukprot:CAMPEP_0202362356 /NCGR_PEP_ID=MMETSP1126-20121109/14563_1 /ASSEMBLY_ACC=CAM_ASM_000457 /TAXON_ID=3047 /ORGANISM="Dunaliella tertiolecta, Strain CCMP1320" /LENGTH=222 /DNA_ID=CAMNT_0048956515 /DNA_START=34 /DNA_END=702 /DNA_ORIENTATION=+